MIRNFSWIAVLVSTLLASHGVNGYPNLAKQIPNGDSVPHPCKPNVLWEGVGHYNEQGGAARNPFGLDFDAAGKVWTEALCRKDSDGDGKTNGQELGDPNCTWTPNSNPAITSGLSHPGVCEPTNSTVCQQKTFSNGLYSNHEQWMAVACKYDEFTCEALNDPEIRNQTLRIPMTDVPANETVYICTIFDFEAFDQDVQMVATQPYIDNRDVMHHIVMFGCDGDITDRKTGVPFRCGMNVHSQCQTMMGIWTVGQSGECSHPDAGFRLGLHGFKKIAFQFHWNNPEKRSDYKDSSGMTLYYTPKLRKYDSSVLMIGELDFVIPPGEARYSVKSTCSASCTRNIMSKSAYITAAWNHMHYLGIGQTIEHVRNGTVLRYITKDDTYSYDSPKTHFYSTPIEVKVGDELKTTYYYNSAHKTTSTLFGESTQAEMCFGFIYYYPKDAINDNSCTSYGPTVAFCDPTTYSACNTQIFVSDIENQNAMFKKITSNCLTIGKKCLVECKAAIRELRAQNPCLTISAMWEFIVNTIIETPQGRLFLDSLASCDAEIAVEDAKADWEKQNSNACNGASNAAASTIFREGLASGVTITASLAYILRFR